MRLVMFLLAPCLPGLAQATVPRVVTDIPPVHALVSQVMDGLGEPVLLLAKGADEHDFALRPSQARSVADADLVVWIGPELTPWLERALDGAGDDAVKLGLLHAEGTVLREDPDAQSVDPHAWLDPTNAKVWLGLIADDLARLDPEHAAQYGANAAAAMARVDALDAELSALLAPVRTRPIVTFHAAYGYYADHFGLQVAGSLREGDAAQPGAARLSQLRARLASGGVACLFPEALHDPAEMAQLADGVTVRIGGPLDPVGSTLDPGPLAYDALLRGITQTIAACLKG